MDQASASGEREIAQVALSARDLLALSHEASGQANRIGTVRRTDFR